VPLEEVAGSISEAGRAPSESEWRPLPMEIKEEEDGEASLLEKNWFIRNRRNLQGIERQTVAKGFPCRRAGGLRLLELECGTLEKREAHSGRQEHIPGFSVPQHHHRGDIEKQKWRWKTPQEPNWWEYQRTEENPLTSSRLGVLKNSCKGGQKI
ncbi:UNVERIFIED_CONTAM: hypothetical protein K2H54_062338, partial [Gekko kuhli]